MKKNKNILIAVAITTVFLFSFFYAVQPQQVADTVAVDISSGSNNEALARPSTKPQSPQKSLNLPTAKEVPSKKEPLRQNKQGKRPVQKNAESRSSNKVYVALNSPNDNRYNSKPFISINAPAAWDLTTGSRGVTVAVLDSGFALDHEDLTGQWSFNLGEVGEGKESDGIDNDGNGYVDDFRGWDFSAADNSPQTGAVDPGGQGVTHGTEVSGLIGATGNNAVGSTGVAWNTTLLPLQVLSDDGSGYSDDIVDAIYYAVEQGVDVINMSFGTSGDDPAVRVAVDYAISQNVVVVAAAGNCGNNLDGVCVGQSPGYVTFPASYNKVIAVGAVDDAGRRASFSSYGQRVDIVAPGSGTLVAPTWSSINQTSAYENSLYGTSFSSPVVAGSAALLRSIDSFGSEDIKALLLASSRKTNISNGIYSPEYGHGIMDIGRSVSIAEALRAQPTVQPPELVSAGDIRPEHDAITANLTSVGCLTEIDTWCTILLKNNALGYDRYLPYQQTKISGLADWTWSGGLLTNGTWQITARQGSRYSISNYFEVSSR